MHAPNDHRHLWWHWRAPCRFPSQYSPDRCFANYELVGFEFYSAFAAGAFAARVVLLRVRGIESTATSGRGRPGPRLKLFSVPRRYRSKALELVTGFILSARCRITFKYC